MVELTLWQTDHRCYYRSNFIYIKGSKCNRIKVLSLCSRLILTPLNPKIPCVLCHCCAAIIFIKIFDVVQQLGAITHYWFYVTSVLSFAYLKAKLCLRICESNKQDHIPLIKQLFLSLSLFDVYKTTFNNGVKGVLQYWHSGSSAPFTNG